jgi:hypothetical protein
VARDVKTHDKTMALKNVKYKNVWTCDICGEKVRMPRDAWDEWSHDQRKAFKDELERRHLVHP